MSSDVWMQTVTWTRSALLKTVIATVLVFAVLAEAATSHSSGAVGSTVMVVPQLEIRLQRLPSAVQRPEEEGGARGMTDVLRSGCHGTRCFDNKRFGRFAHLAQEVDELRCFFWASKADAARADANGGEWATHTALATWLARSANSTGEQPRTFLDEVLLAAGVAGNQQERRDGVSCLSAQLGLIAPEGADDTSQPSTTLRVAHRSRWWYDRHNVSQMPNNRRTSKGPLEGSSGSVGGFELLPTHNRRLQRPTDAMEGRWTCELPAPTFSELSIERVELVCRHGDVAVDNGGHVPSHTLAVAVATSLLAPCRLGRGGNADVGGVIVVPVPASAVVCLIEFDVVRPAPISAKISLVVLFPTALVFMAIMGYLILSPSYQRSVASQRLARKFDELQDWVSQRERTLHTKAELEGTLGIAGRRTVVNDNTSMLQHCHTAEAEGGGGGGAGGGASVGMRRRFERLSAMGLPAPLQSPHRVGVPCGNVEQASHQRGAAPPQPQRQTNLRGTNDAHRAVYNNPHRRTLGELLAHERGLRDGDGAAPALCRKTDVVPDVADYYSDVFGAASGPTTVGIPSSTASSRHAKRDRAHRRGPSRPARLDGAAAVDPLLHSGDSFPIDGAL